MGNASKKEPGKSNLPFGASPITLILAGLALVALAVTYLPGLFAGNKRQTASRPASRPVSSPAPAATVAKADASPATAAVATVSPADELSTFLLRFGRANPFAETSAKSGKSKRISAQTVGNATIENLRSRVEHLGQGGGSPTGESSGAPTDDGFRLTGIVRYAHLSLAVIVKEGKTYYVLDNEAIGKTGYVVRSINQDNAVIVSGDKELVLRLRGNRS